mmetsp:Transcript_17359/g.26126  ORF Transcript_17359/g.26126 Transcript_17359/m.26126 type:complete len:80 (-) Transcript_17359:104-343(-)
MGRSYPAQPTRGYGPLRALSDTPSLVRIVEPDGLTFQAARLLLARLSTAWDCSIRTSPLRRATTQEALVFSPTRPSPLF